MAGIVATWDEMKNAAPGQDMGSFPKNVARAAKDVLCAANAITPEWMTQGGVGGIIGSPLVRDLCRRVTPPSSAERLLPFNGGQCSFEYEFQGSVTANTASGSTATSSPGTWRARTLGPLQGKFIDYQGPIVNGNQTVRVGFIGSDGVKRVVANIPGSNYVSDTLEVRRVDLGPDNCGDRPPPPVKVPEVGDIMRPMPIPVPGGPPVIIPVVIPVGVLFKPTLQVNVGDINVNFDAGGVTFSPVFNINPVINRPSGEPQPSLQPAPPLPPLRPPSNPSTGDNDCPDPCQPIELETIEVDRILCELKSGDYEPSTQKSNIKVLKGEKDAWTLLFNQFIEGNKRLCETKDAPNVGLSLIGAGTAEPNNRTFFFPVDDKVVSVIVRIVSIDSRVTLYTISSPGNEQGKFGNVALCVPGVGGSQPQWGDPGWLWCRDTWYGLPKTGLKPRSLRLTLQAGISFEVYDTGERL